MHLLLNVTKADLDEILIPSDPSTTNMGISTVLQDAGRLTSEASWCQKIIPLKISSAIQAPNSDILCFVLVILIDEGRSHNLLYIYLFARNQYSTFISESANDGELVWLLLKDEDVAWKDLLIPHQMFGINISSEICTDYFR